MANTEIAKPAPYYIQVKEMIQENILSGRWPPNMRIPSEAELVSELGFSRMTVNRALRELATEGALKRIQGVGTFVAKPKGRAALFAVNNIADEIRERGHTHSLDVVMSQEQTASEERALSLGLRVGERVFRSIIVHKEEGRPVQLEDRYVNPAAAPDYCRQDFTLETPYAYLSRMAPLSEGEHVVEAVLASPNEQRLLETDAQEPCLLIRRRTWSGNIIVTSARLLYPGSRYRLEGHFGS